MGRRNSRLARLLLLVAVAAFVVTCSDSPARPGGFEGPLFAVSDGASGGNPDVFFLPPLMESPSGDPDFGDRLPNDMLLPYARVCELNVGDDDEEIPDPLICLPDGAAWDLPMTYGGGFYTANLKDIPDEITPDSPHLRIAIVLGEPGSEGRLELAYRDVDPQGEPSRECTSEDDFCGYNVNGSGGLPVKVVIETGAVCWELDEDADLDACVAATLSEGGSLAFPYDGSTVGVASVDVIDGAESATISIRTCDDLRYYETRPTPDKGRVDLPTFGTCLLIVNANDPLEVFGTVTHCDAFDEATTPVSEGGGGLSHEAAERMTVHRFTPGDTTYAMPHAQYHSDCAEAAVPGGQAFEFTKLESIVRLARRTWRAVGNQVLALIEPPPAWACHHGGCAGAGPFRSHYQVAQPSWIGFGVNLNPGGLDVSSGWWNLGAYDVGTVVTAKVQAKDSGEDHDGSVGEPEPVNNVRLDVTVNGVYSDTIVTGPDGIASFDLTVGPGANTVVISGFGVGTEGLDGTENNVFAPSLTAVYPTDPEVKLGTGSLTFTAFGLVPLEFFAYPEELVFMMDEDGLSASLPGFAICTLDGEPWEGIPFRLVAVNNNGSWVELEYHGEAVPKYPDDAFLAGLVTGSGGCFVSNDFLTINKTGAYRLVLNPVFNTRDKVVGGDDESPKFNVKPYK